MDPYIKVFDVRMMRELTPISVPTGAQSVKFIPGFSATMAVVSYNGQLQLLDAEAGAVQNYHTYQVCRLLWVSGHINVRVHMWCPSRCPSVAVCVRWALPHRDMR